MNPKSPTRDNHNGHCGYFHSMCFLFSLVFVDFFKKTWVQARFYWNHTGYYFLTCFVYWYYDHVSHLGIFLLKQFKRLHSVPLSHNSSYHSLLGVVAVFDIKKCWDEHPLSSLPINPLVQKPRSHVLGSQSVLKNFGTSCSITPSHVINLYCSSTSSV